MRRARNVATTLGCAFALLALILPAARADEVVTLPTRPGVTQSYLLVPATSAPKVMAVMFPGGYGELKLPIDGSLRRFGPRANFLVRTRNDFRDKEVGVAIVDAPSDYQAGGYTDEMRTSAAHVEDISAVVRDLRTRFPGARIVLMATSRSTPSGAYVGRALSNLAPSAIDGVIETSTFVAGGRESLANFDWSTIKVPLLFVHHENDACRFCPYYAARGLGERYPLITVRGGRTPETGPCDALTPHGYFGKETETVAAIKAWMLGRPFPKLIE